MKVCFVVARFSLTGVPLAQLRLARAFAGYGHDVDFIIGVLDLDCTFSENKSINIKVLDKRRVLNMLGALIKYFMVMKPDVVFSAEDHLNTVVLLAAMIAGTSARISCSSRVTPFDTYSSVPLTKRWILKWLARAVMSRANVLTCVSQDMVKQYQQVFRNAPHVCVYNSVVDSLSRARMQEPVSHPWLEKPQAPLLVAAGRLAAWKGFASLIDAMALLMKKQNAKLLILGDGPLRAELQAQIEMLGLAQQVQLLGYVDNPLKYFAKAQVFVLSSLVEGMPNVLVEAMMCGCTPVATDCPTGPRELLQGGRYGYLVPVNDSQAMAKAMQTALEHPVAKELLEEAIVPFGEDSVMARHLELLSLDSRPSGRPSTTGQ